MMDLNTMFSANNLLTIMNMILKTTKFQTILQKIMMKKSWLLNHGSDKLLSQLHIMKFAKISHPRLTSSNTPTDIEVLIADRMCTIIATDKLAT